MDVTKVNGVCALIDRNAADFPHMWEALQVAGATTSDNRRLALLGDAVIQLILIDAWYPSGTSIGIGSDLVQMQGSNANLCAIFRHHNMRRFLYVGPSYGRAEPSDKMMSATIEAIIGAVYLDADLTTTVAVMRTLGFPI